MQCVNDRRYERLGHISDSETDDLRIRVRVGKRLYFLCNITEQIAAR